MVDAYERVGGKAPTEVVGYGIDWSEELDDATIASSLWTVLQGTVVPGATLEVDEFAYVALSGGTLGEVCRIRNTITTSEGETLVKTMELPIIDR